MLGFTIALDISTRAKYDLGLVYDLCSDEAKKGDAWADLGLANTVALEVGGDAKAILEFGGESREGGVRVYGNLNFEAKPFASVGHKKVSDQFDSCWDNSCIALEYGHGEDGLNFELYWSVNDREETKQLKVWKVPANYQFTKCLDESKVDVNGVDPDLAL